MSTDPALYLLLIGSGFLLGAVAEHYAHILHRRMRHRRVRRHVIHVSPAIVASETNKDRAGKEGKEIG